MTWDINKISEQIRQETARNVKQWQNRYRQNNVFDKGGGANRKQGTPSNKEAFIKEMNRELSLRPDLDTPQFKDWLTRLVSLESGYNSNAKSPGSSASGYFQLLKSNRHTGDQWEDMATLTRRNLAAINALSPQLKKMAAEKGLDKWDLLSIAHFQGAGSLAIVIQGANPKDATGFSTSSYLNRMHGRRTKDFNYSYQAPRYEDVDYEDIVPSSQEEEAPAPTENAFLKAINARIAETQAAMDALHEENVQRNPELARNIFASNTEEAPSPNSFLPRTTQSAQVPQSNYALEGVPSYDSDEYFNALQQKYMPEYSPLEELMEDTPYNQYLALGGPVNTNNPIPNFAQNVHQKIPAVRYDDGGLMDLKLPSATNVDFNVQPQESAPELPVNNTSGNTAKDTSTGVGQAFQNQKLPSENVMFPNTSVSREELQQRTAQSWNANKDFNASPQFYDDYGWRVKKHHPEVTDTAFNAVKNTTPIVTRKIGPILGYQIGGEYMPQSGSVQIDKYNGVFPDVVAHEMGHAFDYKLNLTGNTPGGNLDRTLLNNAYPTIHGIADEDIEERRAVNTQLRSVIQQKSGKSASDLDTYIQNMDTKAMQNAVKSMHTDYLKSTAVSDESLPAIKNALQDVAFIPLKAIIQQKSGKTGDELDSYIDGLDNKSMQKLLNLQDSKLQSGTISSQSLSALKDDLQNPDIAFNPERALNRAAYGGNIYDGTTESSQQMNNNNSSWWERTTNAVKGFLNIPIEASNRRVSIQKDRGGHYTFNGRTPSEGYTYYDEATGNVYKFIKGKRTLLHQSDSSKKAKKENEKHPLSTEKTKQQDEYIGQAPLYGLQDERTAGGWNSAQLYLNVNPQDRISPGIAMVDGMHYAFDGRDRSYSSKGDEALWLRHLGGTRNMEEMPVRGIRFSGDLESKRNKAEYTGIPDYAKQAILNEIKNGHIEVDPNGAWTQREESMFNNHKDLTQYANFSIRENNDSGIYDVFDTYDFPVEKWYVPNINRYPNKQIEVRDTIHGPNAIPELYDPTFSSKKVRKRYKSLGGTINLFANGGRTQFNKDYPGLAGIQFNVVPDSNFNAKNVGFGNIEYMPQGEQGVQYTPDYYYSNPDPTTNNIVYNPEAYSSQQAVNEAIALDAISHAGHQNATYDALHALLGNEYPKEAVAQARDAVGNDALFDQEMGNPYSETRQFIYPAAVDGQVRAALFEEMHPNKQDSAYEEQNYYPYFREEFQKNESEDANRYLSDLSKYIKTGKKPKYVLPETTVKGKRK